MDIQIEKDGINKFVTALTGRAGRARDAYEKYVCSPDNYAMLAPFYASAISEVEGDLRREVSDTYNCSMTMSDQDVTLHLDDHNNRLSQSVRALIATKTKLAITCMLAMMWLSDVDADAAKWYGEQAQGHLQTAVNAMRQRDAIDVNYETADDMDDITIKDDENGMLSEGPANDDRYYEETSHNIMDQTNADSEMIASGNDTVTQQAIDDNMIIRRHGAWCDCMERTGLPPIISVDGEWIEGN